MARYGEANVWFKHQAWIPAAWLLSFGNLVSVWFAAQPAEPWHATTHALLATLFALGARRLMDRRRAGTPTPHSPQAIGHNDPLQQTIDGMQTQLRELEERMDFAERLLARHRESDRPGISPR